MKFKKNDKIRMVETYCNADKGYVGEIRGICNGDYAVYFSKLDKSNGGHDCSGIIPEGGGHYIPEDYMELLMTFPQKLEKFKTERVGFHVDTKEIADELQKVFDKEELNGSDGCMGYSWRMYGYTGKLYVSYNCNIAPILNFGLCDITGVSLKEILPITLEELKEYNGITPVTITITSDGYHRVTAESNGKTAEALCNPTDTFDVAEGAKLAIQRLTAEEPKDKLMFHKGDLVEVLKVIGAAPKETEGLQGVVMENSFVTYVKFPVDINGRDYWAYYQSELKLIRRANA